MDNIRTYIFDWLNGYLPEWSATAIIIGVFILVWIFLGIIAIALIRRIIFKVMKIDKRGAKYLTIAKLVSSIVRFTVWFIVIIVVLEEVNIDVTPFIASAGVLGIAIGFGSQEIVKDFISGFFIIFEGEFSIDDVIEVDGFKGKVLEIGLRTTIIQSWKGEIKIVKNGDINSVINYSMRDSMAIIDFGVAYDTDLSSLAELMPELLENIEKKYDLLTDKPKFLGVTELADSSINLRIIAQTQSMQHFQIERDIRKDIVEHFNKHNIEIPFPQVVVHNDKD